MSILNINSVIKAFVSYYPDLKPKAIYDISDGFLIYAPQFEDETDYADPYYFISKDLSIANQFNMKNRKQMFKAFDDGPIWKL